MKSRSVLLIILLLPLFFLGISALVYHFAIQMTDLNKLHLPSHGSPYPATRRETIVDPMFGVPVSDPYRWLEDGKSPDVIAWTQAEDRLTRAYLETLSSRKILRERFRELFYLDVVSTPTQCGNRLFFTRCKAGQEKAVLYFRDENSPEEKVILDPNISTGDEPISLGISSPSDDGKKIAYGIRPKNADEATLYVKNLETGAIDPNDVITGAKYANPSWTPDGRGFYYTYLPPADAAHIAERPGLAEIRFHTLGTPPASDRVIHPKTGDAETFLNVGLSRDGRWLFVSIDHGWTQNEIYFQDLKQPHPQWTPLITHSNALYEVTAWKDQFYILTNESASRYHLFKTSALSPNRKNWKEIVPEQSDATIQGFLIADDHLILTLLKKASGQMQIHQLDGSLLRSVELPALGALGHVTGEPDQTRFYFSFSSPVSPPVIYAGEIQNPRLEVWSKINVPIDPEGYEIEQVHYPSKDGTMISMFLVYHKNFKRDGRTPFLLTGYGGFGISMEPSFSAGIYPWLEAGGGFALANLRGGGEEGEDWHRQGMLRKKQNVFDDFIAAGEYLVEQNYTRKNRLVIKGGSNGGLLMGAAITQRPDLFQAALCGVPLLDMIRYPLFGSGKTWVPEYGSPQDPEDFKALYAYSPYHHVKAKTEYPATLFLSSADDDRVDPMHARKMVAELQAKAYGDHPYLLRVEKEAGHTGADQIKQAVEASTDAMAFIMNQVGLKPANP